jgi:hypothetical protein
MSKVWVRYGFRWVVHSRFRDEYEAERYFEYLQGDKGRAQRDSNGIPFYFLQRGPESLEPTDCYQVKKVMIRKGN